MATLSNYADITITEGVSVMESVSVYILPLSAVGVGTGKMIHPTLGTLNYPYAPDKWTNIDTDLIVPPVWASTQTLNGGASTLWAGNIKDTVVTESWTGEGGLTLPVVFVRALLSFWMNPPAPETAYIQWYPSYTNELGYNIMITNVTCGGKEVTMDYITRKGWLTGGLEVTIKVASRVE